MACIAASTAFLVLELEVVLRPFPIAIRAGILLLLGAIIWLIDLVRQRVWRHSFALPADFFKFLIVLSVLFLGISLGWYDNGGTRNEFAVRQYFRLISNAFALLAVLWYGLRSAGFRRLMLGLLCLPVIFLPFLYRLDTNLSLISRDYFFRGFTEKVPLRLN